MSRGKKLVELALNGPLDVENNINFLNAPTDEVNNSSNYHNDILVSYYDDLNILENVQIEVLDSSQIAHIDPRILDNNCVEQLVNTIQFNPVSIDPVEEAVIISTEHLQELTELSNINAETLGSENSSMIFQSDGYCPEFRQNNISTDPISDESKNSISLVPYSEHSDSDMSDLPQKSKTRKKRILINKMEWFTEKNKTRREQGKRYYGRIKKDGKWNYQELKQPRVMKTRCRCKSKDGGLIKCSTISEEKRQSLFKLFWQLKWGEKKTYINDTVSLIPIKRQRDRKIAETSRRAQSLVYNLRVDDCNIRVCKTMYLNTLGIGRMTVLNWKNATKNSNGPIQYRKSQLEPKNPFENQKEELIKFFDLLPIMESHYCRATTSKHYLLPEWSSKFNLYKFYVEDWCKSKNKIPLSRTRFYEVFDYRNLALFQPKKDQCEKCRAFKVGQVSEPEQQLHIKKKEEAREEKKKDKENHQHVFTADLQAVLMAPKSKVSSLYYRTKLQVHNLCFYNLNNHDGFCYIWNESEGGVNAEEFASIWTNFIENKFLPSIQDEEKSDLKNIIYSDGCCHQNRNCLMSNALSNVAVNCKITIEQKYLEVGHTQMEADSMHSTIERCVRDKIINLPADYAYYCKIARKKPRPYEVSYLNYDFFKKFDAVEVFKSIRPGRGKGDAKVIDIRALKYTTDGDIFYKLRFGDEWSLLPQRKTQRAHCSFNELPQFHQNRLKITARKYEDLQHLKFVMPLEYHDYYDKLPHY